MTGIIVVISLLVIESVVVAAIGCNSRTYDYQTDLRNISYQLSRIADALNKTDDVFEEKEVDL